MTFIPPHRSMTHSAIWGVGADAAHCQSSAAPFAKNHRMTSAAAEARQRHQSSGRFDPRRCVALVPYHASIEAECEAGLRELERRGYAVWRVGGNAQIDVARNQMATDALADRFEETLWIDADVVFDADSDRLRTHSHGIVGGLYARKSSPGFACSLLPGTRSIGFGERGGLVEVLYLGTGFLLVRRAVYLAVQKRFKLPVCNEQFGKALVPFFQPLVREVEAREESSGGGGDLRSGGGGSVGDRPRHASGELPLLEATRFVKTQGVPPAVGINPTARDTRAQRGGHWYLGEQSAAFDFTIVESKQAARDGGEAERAVGFYSHGSGVTGAGESRATDSAGINKSRGSRWGRGWPREHAVAGGSAGGRVCRTIPVAGRQTGRAGVSGAELAVPWPFSHHRHSDFVIRHLPLRRSASTPALTQKSGGGSRGVSNLGFRGGRR